MGQDTDTSRGYAWGLQTDYVTQKTIAAAALTKIIATDNNSIDYRQRPTMTTAGHMARTRRPSSGSRPMMLVSIIRWRHTSTSSAACSF
jgi:hypothetical protein